VVDGQRGRFGNGHQNVFGEAYMFQIGFGLLLYKLLLWSLWFFVPMIVGPFIVNLFGGKGYVHYAGRMWRFVFHVLSLGLLKHKTPEQA
jgi:hypothetical protein